MVRKIVAIKQMERLNTTVLDLRTNYVQFVLAFFKHGDADIKKQVLSVKGLVSGVFVGMDEDAYPVIPFEKRRVYKSRC